MNPELAKQLAAAALTLVQRANLTVQEIDGVQNVRQFLNGIQNGTFAVTMAAPVNSPVSAEPLECPVPPVDGGKRRKKV